MKNFEKKPQPIDGLQSLFDAYSAFIFDQWGVLHEGANAYPKARETLAELKKRGKKIILLSNSGKFADSNLKNLNRLGFDSSWFDHVITSGEALLFSIQQKIWPFLSQPVMKVPSHRYTQEEWEKFPLAYTTDWEKACSVLLRGIDEEVPFEDYKSFLKPALENKLPLLCVNPDQYAITEGGRLFFGPGTLAGWYEEFGQVYYLGKPHPEVYDICKKILSPFSPSQTLCIGDSLDHDIAGGNQNGFPTLLLGQGILKNKILEAAEPIEKIYQLSLIAKAFPDYYSFGL